MDFDIDTYMRVGGRLELDGLDLDDGFRDQPLDAGTLRCLQYMHDIENHTVCYLRDVLVTDAHQDPEITTFLTLWNYEEHWHGEALGRVLAAHGQPAGRSRIANVRRQLDRFDRLRPVTFVLGSVLVPDMVAIHMVWGAINEWTTQAGYSLLARKAKHPVLSELLKRIMRQEGRHIDFYATEGGRRLAGSRISQRVTRAALRRYWRPVGHKVRPDAEISFLVDHLFSDPQGMKAADRIDRNVDRLPGLEGLHLVRNGLARYAS
ncbi:MAG: ferritin-like domain-containing protein [Actinomycetota bacterium]|nr:ferritin-like domain-containing protein [Actinomycetota bacterium]